MVSFGVFGVLIIPKWLIKVPGPFAIFLDNSGNFENLVKIWTRGPPNYYQNASNNTRKYGIILEKYYCCQSGTSKNENFRNLYVLGTSFSDFVRFVFSFVSFSFWIFLCFVNIYIYIF